MGNFGLTDNMERAFSNAAEWLLKRKLAGQDMLLNAHKKTIKEATELADDPSLEELADVYICLVGVSLQNGWSMRDVAAAIEAKNAINEGRTWHRLPDGTWQHD